MRTGYLMKRTVCGNVVMLLPGLSSQNKFNATPKLDVLERSATTEHSETAGTELMLKAILELSQRFAYI